MNRAFFYLTLLAFCSAAPYSGFNSVQPTNLIRFQQQDESQVVDSLGAGYSFFQKQPIGARPLSQQRLAIDDQTSFSGSDDSSIQWSDYTRASALTAPKTIITQDQSSYTSTVNKYQTQELPLVPPPIVRKFESSYGQQQAPLLVPQQPIVRNFESSYSQQQAPLVVPQPVVRNFESSYSQQQTPAFVPLPTVRNFDSSYSQQQAPLVVPQQPIVRNFDSSYGQQQAPLVVPQQPIVRNFESSYSQQQAPLVVPQQPIVRNFESSYGQQQAPAFVPLPTARNFGSTYGQ